jgi:hypothetical protein
MQRAQGAGGVRGSEWLRTVGVAVAGADSGRGSGGCGQWAWQWRVRCCSIGLLPDVTDDVDVKAVNCARSQWERGDVGASALREELGRGR